MIEIWVDESGFVISGDHESVLKSHPIKDADMHVMMYQIICEALSEVCNYKQQIYVYGNSRVIEEINGVIGPINSECKEWVRYLRRHILPRMSGCVFFNKKSAEKIKDEKSKSRLLDKSGDLENIKRNQVLPKSRRRMDPKKWRSRLFGINSD